MKIYKLTSIIQKEIIDYCLNTFNYYYDMKVLKEYDVKFSTILEMMYKFSVDYYCHTGNYHILYEDLEKIYLLIRNKDLAFEKYKKGEIKLLAVDKNDNLFYNLDATVKINYNKKLKIWEEVNE